MTEFNFKKLIPGAIVCALVVGVVTASQFLAPTSSTQEHAAAHATSTSSRSHTASAAVAVPAGKVNINTADEQALQTLKGIGASKAAAIVSYRGAHGLFYKIDDITKVKGIGPAMLAAISADITVGNVTPPLPAKSETTPTAKNAAAPKAPPHLLITAVMAGSGGNEYVELFNPNAEGADLTSWSLKMKNSAGSVSTLVASSRFAGKQILAGKHFLLAGAQYTGSVSADITWPSSYTFAHSSSSVMLYNNAGALSDSVSWSSIPNGKSYVLVGTTFQLQDPTPRNSSL